MDAGSNHSSAAEGLAEDLEVAGCGLAVVWLEGTGSGSQFSLPLSLLTMCSALINLSFSHICYSSV